jgi:AcrR family transcriptional regulator
LIRRADQTIDTEQIAEHWDRMGQLYASTHRRNVSQLGGTPRDLEATALVLQTVLDLLDEEGFAHLTIQKIVQRSGVAKTTIYRRWPNVASIVMDAFLSDMASVSPISVKETATETVRTSMRLFARTLKTRRGQLLRALLSRAQYDQDLKEAFWLRWIKPRRDAMTEVLRRGVATGEFRRGLDLDIVIDGFYGPIYYRLLVPYADLSNSYIDSLAMNLLRGIASK